MRTGFDVEMRADTAITRLFRAGSRRTRLVTLARDASGRLTCAVVGRLHYRDDLAWAFPALRGQQFASDAALALALFQAGGPEALARLEGEFSLVLADTRHQRVLARRDPMGTWPLFHTSIPHGVLVGTSLLDLARRAGRSTVHRDHVATYLMWPFAGVEFGREATAIEGIQRVLPGALVEIRADGSSRTLVRHDWTTPTQTGLTLDEAAQQLRQQLTAAVRERLEPGSTAAHLSGGMDSSAVVCLARDLLRQAGDDRPVETLSLVYDLPSLAPETEYIQMVLDQGGPVRSHFLDGDQLFDFDWFDTGVVEHDEPYAGLCQLAMERHLMDEAESAGATTVLTGGGAEIIAEGANHYLADLIRSFHWKHALAEVRSWARGSGDSAWSILWRQGLEPLVPAPLRDGLGVWLRGGWAAFPRVGLGAIPPWISPRFARGSHLRARGLEAVRRFFRAPFEESAARFGADCLAGEWAAPHLAGPAGIHLSRPFLDARLVRLGLSLPREVRLVPGRVKPVLQEAMRGVLPEPIRTRRWKRHFNDVYRLGLSRRLGDLEQLVQRSALADMDLLDTAELLRALRHVAAGLGEMSAAGRLNATLALVAWHDHLGPALRRPADEPTLVVRSWADPVTQRGGHAVHH
ncbi:MAG: asparagine synthase-related protein [Gemmataceae bacterium]